MGLCAGVQRAQVAGFKRRRARVSDVLGMGATVDASRENRNALLGCPNHPNFTNGKCGFGNLETCARLAHDSSAQ